MDFFALAKRMPDVEFIWAGGFSFGKISDGYEEIKKEMEHLPENVRMLGLLDREVMNEVYNMADVMFLPSYEELFPMTILEAISQGLPVITTDVGGIKEVLTYGKYSEVTDCSVERIHTAMDKILLDYEAYAKAAYDKSLQFDYRKVNRKVFDVLNESLHW